MKPTHLYLEDPSHGSAFFKDVSRHLTLCSKSQGNNCVYECVHVGVCVYVFAGYGICQSMHGQPLGLYLKGVHLVSELIQLIHYSSMCVPRWLCSEVAHVSHHGVNREGRPGHISYSFAQSSAVHIHKHK